VARTAQARHFKPAVISGSLYKLTTVAGATANNATIARYAAGGLSSSRRFTPLAAATADVAVPTVGTAAANFGWRDDVAENAADQVRYAAGTWGATIRYRRSGQALEVDQAAKVTVIFYRVSSAGTFVAELARVTSATITYTVTVQSLALTTASIGPFTFSAGDKVQVEVYVVTEAAGVAAAPTVATDLWLTIDESSTSSRVGTLPTYDILYARGIADTAAATDALIRAGSYARAIADTAPATHAVTRAASFPRAISDSAPATHDVTRAGTFARAIPDSAPATHALTRVGTFARSIPDTAPATHAVTRAGTFARALADTAPATHAVTRSVSFPRAIADSAPASHAVGRSAGIFARSIADSAPAVDTLARLITYGRFIDEEIGTVAVDPVRTVGRRIAGVARDTAGTPVAGALVKLVRQADDRVVRSMTTPAGGAYSFDRDILDVAGRDGVGYYVISYVDGSAPQIHGVSDRGLLPELI